MKSRDMYIASASRARSSHAGSFDCATTRAPFSVASTLLPNGSQSSAPATLPLTIAAAASSITRFWNATFCTSTPCSSSQMPM